MVLEGLQSLIQTPDSSLWGIFVFVWICFQYSKLEYHSPSHALCVCYVAYQSNKLIQIILLGTQAGSPGILINDTEWIWFFGVWLIYFFTPLFSVLYKFPPAKIFLELMVSLAFARQLVTQFTFAQIWLPEQTVGPIFSAAMGIATPLIIFMFDATLRRSTDYYRFEKATRELLCLSIYIAIIYWCVGGRCVIRSDRCGLLTELQGILLCWGMFFVYTITSSIPIAYFILNPIDAIWQAIVKANINP